MKIAELVQMHFVFIRFREANMALMTLIRSFTRMQSYMTFHGISVSKLLPFRKLERYFYTMVDNSTIDELFGISLSMSSRIQVQADRTFQL